MTQETQIQVPQMDGIKVMTPMEMNTCKFVVSHTILVPGLLSSIKSSTRMQTKLKNNG